VWTLFLVVGTAVGDSVTDKVKRAAAASPIPAEVAPTPAEEESIFPPLGNLRGGGWGTKDRTHTNDIVFGF
jgi:hypothetical protein